MSSTINMSRAVARRLVDQLILEPEAKPTHPDVVTIYNDLINALDEAQGDTPSMVTLHISGTSMDLEPDLGLSPLPPKE